MGNIAIGIGGTGARCVETLVHLCAAGLGPEGELWVLLIDPDTANGNVSRATQLISKYISCRKHLNLGKQKDVPIFRTEIKYPGTDEQDMTWSPVGTTGHLGDYLEYPMMGNKARDMCRLLYSEDELELEWDHGFRGRASIGAPVMASMREVLEDRPWFDIVNFAKTELGSRGIPVGIFVFSSIFGATGASGFPTVGTILKDYSESERWQNRQLLKFGGALILPYFSFNVPSQEEGICAHPENFLENTKAALNYYKIMWKANSPYNSVYFLGDQKQDRRGKEFALGGQKQCNFAHFIEFFSALAAKHFYENVPTGKMNQYYLGRSLREVISWGDIPLDTFKNDMLIFTTFAFACLSFYFQLIKQEKEFERNRRLNPWYVDHFRPDELTKGTVQVHLADLEDYLTLYLDWLYQVHVSTDRKLELMNEEALESSKNQKFLRLDDDHMRTLLFRTKEQDKWSYDPKHNSACDKIWEQICKVERAQIDSPIGRLGRLVYKATQRFCISNYNL